MGGGKTQEIGKGKEKRIEEEEEREKSNFTVRVMKSANNLLRWH